ncbi:hypothetical protein ACTFIW_008875, partial [Dictyostelium discoideum]
KTYW